eukprot:10214048-Alexandrium_andersonii.AAC.1
MAWASRTYPTTAVHLGQRYYAGRADAHEAEHVDHSRRPRISAALPRLEGLGLGCTPWPGAAALAERRLGESRGR